MHIYRVNNFQCLFHQITFDFKSSLLLFLWYIPHSAKLWRGKTLANWMSFANILPKQIISIFCKTRDFRITNCMCVSRDWMCELECEDLYLEISPFASLSRSKIQSFRLTIFIFVITLKDTFYRKVYIIDHVTFKLSIVSKCIIEHKPL